MNLDPAIADFIKALARANATRDIEQARRARQQAAADQSGYRKAS